MIHSAIRLLPLAAILIASALYACQVPVFRYALERWPADNYELVVLHDGILDTQSETSLRRLRVASDRSVSTVNFTVRHVDVSQTNDKTLQSIWADNNHSDDPLIVSLYPQTADEVPDRLITTQPLSNESVENILDSPLRQEIAKQLLDGTSAVWIFVPCGDAIQDKTALATLRRFVQENEKTLELPELEEDEGEKELLEQVAIDLRLDFSIVTLHRNDPKEQFFLKMLLASEPDLEELNQPMAFPVIGRGRVLYALVGKGISELTIKMASRFIIGPCSCQVKNQNPGFDLLMVADWDKQIGETKLSDPLPEASEQRMLLTIPPGRKTRSK